MLRGLDGEGVASYHDVLGIRNLKRGGMSRPLELGIYFLFHLLYFYLVVIYNYVVRIVK